jgi:hypothetical protein
VVPETAFVVIINVVVIIDLFILVLYVHTIHHHHAFPSVYEKHTTHPLHLIMHVDVVR